ncbi:MAG: hypothetical protein JXQ73_14255 [Phycisphaerae bacterium]|nr:hypothetical protein [Phycisphaerae bacterium]
MSVLALADGCALHDQVQFFAATDPETGATSYYKMTISGTGSMGVDYHLQAGYFSAEAVDVLRSSMPDIPILDLPVEQLEILDRTAQQFYGSAMQDAKRVSPIKDPESVFVSTRSRLGFAQERADKLKADVALASGQLEHARTRADEAKKERTEADSAYTKAVSSRQELEKSRDAARTALLGYLGAAPQPPQSSPPTTCPDPNETTPSSKPNPSTTKASPKATANLRAAASCPGEAAPPPTASGKEPEASPPPDSAPTPPSSAQHNSPPEQEKPKNLETAVRDYLTAEGEYARAKITEIDAWSRKENARRALTLAENEMDRLRYRLDLAIARQKHAGSAASAAQETLTKAAGAADDVPIGTLPPGVAVDPFDNERAIAVARNVWFASLSQADVISMGRTQNTNPFQFRKLVFWATARNIDLSQFATEVDGVIDNVTTIAQTVRDQARIRKEMQRAQAQKDKADQDARRKTCGELFDLIPFGDEQQREAFKAFVPLLCPEAGR